MWAVTAVFQYLYVLCVVDVLKSQCKYMPVCVGTVFQSTFTIVLI